MRTFSIIALCLVAACANAASISDIRDCVQKELKDKVKAIKDDVDARLEDIQKNGNEAAKEAREQWQKTTEEFQKALEEPTKAARAAYDACVEESGSGFFARAGCLVKAGRGLFEQARKAASESGSELVKKINEIAKEFQNENQGNFDDLRQQGRQLAKDVVAAVQKCARQQ